MLKLPKLNVWALIERNGSSLTTEREYTRPAPRTFPPMDPSLINVHMLPDKYYVLDSGFQIATTLPGGGVYSTRTALLDAVSPELAEHITTLSPNSYGRSLDVNVTRYINKNHLVSTEAGNYYFATAGVDVNTRSMYLIMLDVGTVLYFTTTAAACTYLGKQPAYLSPYYRGLLLHSKFAAIPSAFFQSIYPNIRLANGESTTISVEQALKVRKDYFDSCAESRKTKTVSNMSRDKKKKKS